MLSPWGFLALKPTSSRALTCTLYIQEEDGDGGRVDHDSDDDVNDVEEDELD